MLRFSGKFRLPSRTVLVEYLMLAVTGFVALSGYANVILNRLGFYVVELLLIPILLYYFCKYKLQFGKLLSFKINELGLLLLLIMSISIGIINTGDVFNVITCIRPFVYILIIVKYISSYQIELNLNKLYILAFGSVCGDFVYMQSYSALSAERGYQYINIIAIFMITSIPFIKGKKILGIVSTIFALAVSLLSGYRINILICLVALVSSGLFLLFTEKKLHVRLAYVVLLVTVAFSLNWCVSNIDRTTVFLTQTLNMSEKTSKRSLGRIAGLLENEYTLGDENRLKGFMDPFEEFGDNIIPVGPIGKNDPVRFGTYTDKPMFFFYDLFGSPLAWLIVGAYALYFIKTACRIIIKKQNVSEYNMLFVFMLPSVACLLAINGTFLTFIHVSILFGLVVAGCSVKQKQYGKNNNLE